MSETITEGSPRRSGRIILKSSPHVSLTDMNSTPTSSQNSDSRPASALKKKRVSFEGMEVDDPLKPASAPGSADRKQQIVERVPLPEAASATFGDITDAVMEQAAKLTTVKSVGQLLKEVRARSQSPGNSQLFESVDSTPADDKTTEIPEVTTTKVKSPGNTNVKTGETGNVSKPVKSNDDHSTVVAASKPEKTSKKEESVPKQLGIITAAELSAVLQRVKDEKSFSVMVSDETIKKQPEVGGSQPTIIPTGTKRPLVDLTLSPPQKRQKPDNYMMFTAPLVMYSSQQPAVLGYSPNILTPAPSMSITPMINNARELALSANVGKSF
jgi:hypothetical protein